MSIARKIKWSPLQTHMEGRNNNFNLLRMIGALLIMFAHAMFITIGDDINFDTYPVKYTLGITTLNLFFVLSGFLVTASWLKHHSVIIYATSRAMRILPGLTVVAFFTAFVIGPLMTNHTTEGYFAHAQSWLYWPVTSMLYPDMKLPGVFEGLPNDGEINAPLWTLRYEALFYSGVVVAGLLGLFQKRLFGIMMVGSLFIYFVTTFLTELRGIAFVDHFMHFGYAFLIGAAVQIYRSVVPVSLALPLAGLVTSIALIYTFGYASGEWLLIPSAAMLGLWIAFVPGGVVRYYNAVGDYSYGIYIWHYPIEQIMRTKLGDVSALELYLFSLPVVISIAALSWHFVERPSLLSIKHITPRLRFPAISR